MDIIPRWNNVMHKTIIQDTDFRVYLSFLCPGEKHQSFDHIFCYVDLSEEQMFFATSFLNV